MYDVKDKLALKNKVKSKIQDERPLSLTVFGEAGKKEAEMKVKDDGSLTLFVDGNEVGDIGEESFLYFVESYVNKCIETDDEVEEAEDKMEGEKATSENDDKKKLLAKMMLAKATEK